MELITESAGETQRFGQKIADSLKDGGILALTGDLGSGKTTFVQGFAKGLGILDRIISPTFILLRKYGNFYHIDLYRLEENIDPDYIGVENEVKNLGLEDIWSNPKNIVVIEWAEKIEKMIPKSAKWIKFENLGGSRRKIVYE